MQIHRPTPKNSTNSDTSTCTDSTNSLTLFPLPAVHDEEPSVGSNCIYIKGIPLDWLDKPPESHHPASFAGVKKHSETPLNSQASPLSCSAAKPVWYCLIVAHWRIILSHSTCWYLETWPMVLLQLLYLLTCTLTGGNNLKWSWVRRQDRMCWCSAGHGCTSAQTSSLPEVPHFFDVLLGFPTSTTTLYCLCAKRRDTKQCTFSYAK